MKRNTASIAVLTGDKGYDDQKLQRLARDHDISSLYPNIICTRNVSPDVIRCDCHSDRDDIPGLGYSIFDDRGYLVDVLQPIIDARDEIKAAIRREKDRDDPDEERLAELEGGRER